MVEAVPLHVTAADGQLFVWRLGFIDPIDGGGVKLMSMIEIVGGLL